MKIEHCETCHHKPSCRFDAELGTCDCSCHDIADAAPVLLAACKDMLDYIDTYGPKRYPGEYAKWQAAIALAEKGA